MNRGALIRLLADVIEEGLNADYDLDDIADVLIDTIIYEDLFNSSFVTEGDYK